MDRLMREAADDWVSITGQGFYDGGHWMTCPEVATCEGIVGPDADLIANAPADLAWALDQLDQIRAILADEPDPCPEHPDTDPITCGWKRDITRIRSIIEGAAK